MQGILNALAYGLNPTVRATWLRSLKFNYPRLYAYAFRAGLIGSEQDILLQAEMEEEESEAEMAARGGKIEMRRTEPDVNSEASV